MKALSWKQPFGTAMLYGKIETRVWNTNYRGKVLICTSLREYDPFTAKRICGDELYIRMCEAMTISTRTQKPTKTIHLNGFAIAVGTLVDCRPMEKEDEAKTFVLYHPDLYCHIYEDVKRIVPFHFKGAQRWSNVDKSVIDSIEYL